VNSIIFVIMWQKVVILCFFLKVTEGDLDGEIYSLVSKLLKMEVAKLFVCSLPTLPGKLNILIEKFNEKLPYISLMGKHCCCTIYVKEMLLF